MHQEAATDFKCFCIGIGGISNRCAILILISMQGTTTEPIAVAIKKNNLSFSSYSSEIIKYKFICCLKAQLLYSVQ